ERAGTPLDRCLDGSEVVVLPAAVPTRLFRGEQGSAVPNGTDRPAVEAPGESAAAAGHDANDPSQRRCSFVRPRSLSPVQTLTGRPIARYSPRRPKDSRAT